MLSSRLAPASLACLLTGLLLVRSTGAQTPPAPDPSEIPPPPAPPPSSSDAPGDPPSPPEPPDSAAPPSSAPPTPPAPPASSAPLPPPVPTVAPPPVAPVVTPVPTSPRPPATATPRPTATAAPRVAPPPPPPAAKKPDEPPPAKKKDDDDGEGLFGPFRIGPLVGVGVPGIVSIGGQMKLTRFLGLGVNIGVIPTVKVSLYGKAQISYQEYDAYAHIYPFGGSFFLGSGIGYATMKGSLSESFDVPQTSPPQQVTVSADASVRALVLTPQVGYLYTTQPGFSIGIDVGLQVPIAPSQTSLSLKFPDQAPQSAVQSVSDDVNHTLQKIGKQVVPTFNIKVGWLL